MKTSFVLLALSLALSVSAAPQASPSQAVNLNSDFRNKGNNPFGGFGNNNGNNNNKNNGGNNANNKGNNQNAGGAAGGNANNNANGGSAAGNNSTSTGSNANGGSAAGNNSTSTGNNSNDPQTSLTLDPAVIAKGFANNGQDVPTAGQVASLTSTNNFINFCLTVPNFPITNGQQIKTGSCNPAPMGTIPSTDNMPSSKFISPKNGDTLKANTEFTITMAIRGMQTGFFVNADENYFAAPQQLNAQGQIQGHSHVVVETLSAIDQTTTTDPTKFAFFKGLNAAASNGQLTADVTSGLPAGVYKLSSINTAANHQPVLVPIAQHGSLDDAVYFTVTADGQPDASSGILGGSSNSTAAGNAGSAGAAGAGAAGAEAAGAGAAGAGAAGAAGAGTGTGAAGAGAAGAGAGTGTGAANAGKGNQNANTGKGNQNQNAGGQNNNNNGGRGGRNRRFTRSRL